MEGPPTFVTPEESLAPHTTIGLGGPARWYARCTSVDELRAALRFAGEEGLPVQVFSGGSNIIFDDEGFSGLVVEVALRGVHTETPGAEAIVNAGAGEEWDGIVRQAVERGWEGIECLSGIPGSAGGTPVQNVGAYGQEVAGTIAAVRALERETLRECEFSADECGFGYRTSRFKTTDADRYVITGVTFRLKRGAPPEIKYDELAAALGAGGRAPTLASVREAVLSLRRTKSMVTDPADPNSRSVGSFFTNPVVTRAFYDERLSELRIPTYPSPGGVKVSAAWLVEHAGFPKGFRKGGAGISERHALAIVNRGGTTRDVVALAEEITERVFAAFGIMLDREPVIVPFRP